MDFHDVVSGDMPGDRVQIDSTHIKRANVLFPSILEKIKIS